MIRPKVGPDEVRTMSATPDSTLANPEQRIADLEREITNLQQRLDEAQARETATAEVLQVINSSPGDLAPVFDAMLERALRLCGASFGNLLSYNVELFDIVASVHAEGRIADRQRHRPPFRMRTGSVLQTIVQGAEVGFIEDVRESGSYRADELFREMVDGGGYRSLLNIALRKEGALIGVIGIFRTEMQPFTDKQIALLQNFAAQAVIAMENARLLTETREALEQQTATAEVLGVINSSPGDLKRVCETILEKARTLCGIEHGSLELYDGEYFRAVATIGFSNTFTELVRQGYAALESPDTRALVEGARCAHILDLADTDAVMTRHAVELEGHRTLPCVPLCRDGQLLGMIASTRKEVRAFTDKEIALLENFAAQAVIAMENARLLSELRQRTDEVAELNRGLEARVAERVDELGRVGRLKRFLAPQLAELIVSQGD
jgi:GAF domain-containing protein